MYSNDWKVKPILENLYTSDGALIPSRAVFLGPDYISTVSDEYQLIPNEQCVNLTFQALHELEINHSPIEDIFFNGKRFHAIIRLPDRGMIVGNDNKELIHPIIHIFNSYDKSLAFSVAIAAYRMICTNYLFIDNPKVVKVIHLQRNEISVESVKQVILRNTERFETEMKTWNDWKSLVLTKNETLDIITYLEQKKIPKPYIDRAFELSNRVNDSQMNLWRVYNLFSYIMTSPKLHPDHYPKTSTGKSIILNLETKHRYMKEIKKHLSEWRKAS